MTIEELSRFDGREGRSAYILVSGTIYDVSSSPRWVDGHHEGIHQAGQDLTEALKSAPHVRTVIERFPIIGRIEESAAQPETGRKFPLVPVIIAAVLLLIIIALFI